MSEEVQVAKSISGRTSLKSLSIKSLASIVEALNEQGSDDQLLLLTSYGFIKGDYYRATLQDTLLTKHQDSDNLRFNLSYSHVLRNKMLCGIEEKVGEDNIEIVDNGAAISLKNVSIYKEDLNNPIASFADFIIFADQILGYSLIPREMPQN